ncbi:hypothetical protein [Rhizobium sp. BK251]|uniref:hypothetical protein n=1 Tax=Rhizobium sp. BK251 TaxID=2512125 RepID=UPI0010CFC4EC|nr:hypothetical protein [Rhizobium sp. BK251]TCL71467.1 hypothetical protein EV286_106443 [Rhizobium sp. BK251]
MDVGFLQSVKAGLDRLLRIGPSRSPQAIAPIATRDPSAREYELSFWRAAGGAWY